jgi:hypothetical protein
MITRSVVMNFMTFSSPGVLLPLPIKRGRHSQEPGQATGPPVPGAAEHVVCGTDHEYDDNYCRHFYVKWSEILTWLIHE